MDYLPQSSLSKLARFYGNYQYRKGDYSHHTLRLFSYSQSISFDAATLLDYVCFKRNLGYKPSRLQLNIIVRSYKTLSSDQLLLLLNLLLESDAEYKLLALITPHELAQFSLLSPPIAAYRIRSMPNVPAEIRSLASIADQDKWQEEFFQYFNSNSGSIIVVDGEDSSKNAYTKQLIDAHRVVVGFDEYPYQKNRQSQHCQNIDIWVQTQGLSLAGNLPEQHIKWLVLSGLDVRYTQSDWGAILPYLKRGTRVLTVSLNIWQPLVKKLAVPPSASILFIAWLMYLVPNYRDISVLGFQKQFKKNIFRPFNNDKSSKRHNWESEYELLAKWKQDGLHFIDDHEKDIDK